MASASGPGTGSGECEGEDQDDSSSSDSIDVHEAKVAFDALNVQSNSEDKESEDELSAFRQQWQRELEGTPTPQTDANSQQVAEPETEEEKAKQLFLLGVEYERSGKLYEAIQNYKRAMQILPDVEFRLYESSELRTDTPEAEAVNEEESNVRKENASDDEDEDAVEGEDLLQRLQRIVARKGVICEPATPTKSGHLSWLPYELILLVLRWVVSSDLDATSLERVSAVCRGLYVTARDNDIWRSLCLKTWGVECGVPRAQGFVSWRQMYVERPRIHLHGCYISKTSYLRHGENSFQDAFYRPWYLVDYYRYLRFFPEGTVLMWTTAEEPGSCVAQLRQRTARPALGILRGHYRLVGDRVVVVIRKPGADRRPPQPSHTRFRPRKKEPFEQHDHIFHMELKLRCVRGRRNWQLSWRTYAVSTRRDHWTHFDLCSSKFPPFAFSRVRGYTALADAPL